MEIEFVCWSCGKSYTAQVVSPPRYGVEVHADAKANGLYPCFDLRKGRVLIFCNKSCADKQMTKSGGFRKRPRKVKEEQP